MSDSANTGIYLPHLYVHRKMLLTLTRETLRLYTAFLTVSPRGSKEELVTRILADVHRVNRVTHRMCEKGAAKREGPGYTSSAGEIARQGDNNDEASPITWMYVCPARFSRQLLNGSTLDDVREWGKYVRIAECGGKDELVSQLLTKINRARLVFHHMSLVSGAEVHQDFRTNSEKMQDDLDLVHFNDFRPRSARPATTSLAGAAAPVAAAPTAHTAQVPSFGTPIIPAEVVSCPAGSAPRASSANLRIDSGRDVQSAFARFGTVARFGTGNAAAASSTPVNGRPMQAEPSSLSSLRLRRWIDESQSEVGAADDQASNSQAMRADSPFTLRWVNTSSEHRPADIKRQAGLCQLQAVCDNRNEGKGDVHGDAQDAEIDIKIGNIDGESRHLPLTTHCSRSWFAFSSLNARLLLRPAGYDTFVDWFSVNVDPGALSASPWAARVVTLLSTSLRPPRRDSAAKLPAVRTHKIRFIAVAQAGTAVIRMGVSIALHADADLERSTVYAAKEKLRKALAERKPASNLMCSATADVFLTRTAETDIKHLAVCLAAAGCKVVNVHQSGQKDLALDSFSDTFANGVRQLGVIYQYTAVDLRSLLLTTMKGTTTAVAMYMDSKSALKNQNGESLKPRRYPHSWPHHPGHSYGGVTWTVGRDAVALGAVSVKLYNNSRSLADGWFKNQARTVTRSVRRLRAIGRKWVASAAQFVTASASESEYKHYTAFESRFVFDTFSAQSMQTSKAEHLRLLASALHASSVNIVSVADFTANLKQAINMLKRALVPAPRVTKVPQGTRNAIAAAWQAVGLVTKESGTLSVTAGTSVDRAGQWYIASTFDDNRASDYVARLVYLMRRAHVVYEDEEGVTLSAVEIYENKKPGECQIMDAMTDECLMRDSTSVLPFNLLKAAAASKSLDIKSVAVQRENEQRILTHQQTGEWIATAVRVELHQGSFRVSSIKHPVVHATGRTLQMLVKAIPLKGLDSVYDLVLRKIGEPLLPQLRQAIGVVPPTPRRSPMSSFRRWSTDEDDILLATVAMQPVQRRRGELLFVDFKWVMAKAAAAGLERALGTLRSRWTVIRSKVRCRCSVLCNTLYAQL